MLLSICGKLYKYICIYMIMPKGVMQIEEKKKRMAQALKILRAKKKLPYDKAVALLCWNLGIRQEKAREYIDTLVHIDGIKKSDGNIIRVK